MAASDHFGLTYERCCHVRQSHFAQTPGETMRAEERRSGRERQEEKNQVKQRTKHAASNTQNPLRWNKQVFHNSLLRGCFAVETLKGKSKQMEEAELTKQTKLSCFHL